jgi:tetratricopeptide (TPR) repeat protein
VVGRIRIPKRSGSLRALSALFLCAILQAQPDAEKLAQYRNLGKAFYENPTTQTEAVAEFKKALDLAPDSPRERLNYALALLKAGKIPEGISELERVQKQDPKIPHTYFNLGIQYKKLDEKEKAIAQFRKMAELVPDEPITRYNLGTLYKLTGDPAGAVREFELTAKLDPNLAAARFQLYNLYRASGRGDDATRELADFQRLKKSQEGAAIPEDVEWSFYSEIYDIMTDAPPAGRLPELRFEERNREATAPRGIAGDFNNDGQLDACVVTAQGAELWLNDKGKLRKLDAKIPPGPYNRAVWLDYDHDYDLDLFLLGKKSVLLRNQGAAGFEAVEFPFIDGEAVDAVALRAVADTKGSDLLVSYRDRGAVLYVDKLLGKYEVKPVSLPAGASQLHAADLNNDGWIDVVYSTGGKLGWLRNHEGTFLPEAIEAQVGGEIAIADLDNRGLQDMVTGGFVARNLGDGKFEVQPISLPACKASEVLDADSDGRLDIACDGQVFLNRTVSRNHWIGVKLAGVKNLKLAPLAEVEVKAGARYQKQVYEGVPLIFGLGAEDSVDTVRITWPNGLIQNEMKQAPGKIYSYEEAQRMSGSCPMIFTWNGREFEFITDVLGVAPLGASSGDGEYFPVDHDEYISIPGESLRAADGKYEVRITEELAEVSYLDQIRLIALDHPASEEVLTNDKFKSPPFPDFRLFGVRRRIAPVTAVDDSGHDVLAEVLHKDRRYPVSFGRSLSGAGAMHSLTLDFGHAARSNRAVLVLSGWVDWADGSTFFAAAQEKQGGLVTPSLQVRDREGRWRTVIEDMGMPAGKPKTIAVDLTGKFLSDSRELRIVTNLCVYWDEIFLSEDSSAPEVRQSVVPQLAATLRFRGFSAVHIDPARTQPEEFVYASVKPYSMWNPTPGLYTRYGDVAALTAEVDDKLVVMGSGDELRLLFDASSLPSLPEGWRRDFLLLVDGWAKDRDANTAYSQSTDPLPFHGMTSFPYPATEHYPDDAAHRRYRETYNTRPALRLIRPLASR